MPDEFTIADSAEYSMAMKIVPTAYAQEDPYFLLVSDQKWGV